MVFALSECLYDRDLLLAENDAFLYFLPNGNCMLDRVWHQKVSYNLILTYSSLGQA